MTDPEEGGESTEFPVGELWVHPDDAVVRFPNGDEARMHPDWGHPMVAERAIAELPLGDISEAFAELCAHAQIAEEWFLALQENPHGDDAPECRPGVEFTPLDRRAVAVTVEIDGLRPYADERFEEQVGDILAPLLTRWDARMRRLAHDGSWGGYVAVHLELPTRGRVGADLVRFAEEVWALLRAARSGPLNRPVARDLIVAGCSGALVGLREGAWLDVKRAPYRLDLDSQKYELARDVSAFANAGGGLLLIPATTRRERNGEVIDEVRDLELDRVDVQQIRDVLSAWVHPAIVGLEIEAVEVSGGRGQLMIHVPPQEVDSWPHIVTGAPLGDRVRTQVLAVCVRHDAEIRSLDPGAVHALLRAGRRAGAADPARVTGAVLRGQLPPPLDRLADEAEAVGHRVEVGARELRITPPGSEVIICRYRDLQPITFMLEVSTLCEALAAHGLPTHRTTRGFLMPGGAP